MKLRFVSMTAGLSVGLTAAVVLACSAGAYLYSKLHFQELLATARATELAEGGLIRVALEHQMMENDRTLIARMVESFGRQARVEHLMVLDRNGAVRYSSGPHQTVEDLRLDSPTCQACHRLPPEKRESSRVIETRGGAVLRTVVPILNREQCHRCHDPSHKINGILILDRGTAEIHEAMTRGLRWMVGGTAATALLLVGSIGVVIRIFVLRRLRRFETVARKIAAGDLDRRIPAQGSDTISWLAREFNAMADSMSGLVRAVQDQRERLEMVINSIDDGIVVLDNRRNVIAANDAFLERARYSREQVLGCCCRDIAAGMCGTEDCPTLACLSSGTRQVRMCERRKPDGSVAWEEVHASPILDGSGKLEHVVEVWRDVSERRAAEAHLAESHRLASLGMLASGFSHELNTPLATVLTCVEGILREDTKSGRVRENAAIAREQILRCRGITQHFLRMSRGQHSAGEIVDIESAIAPVIRLVEPAARERSIGVELLPVPASLNVRVNVADLQHAVMNLLLNAVQASPAESSVTVEVAGSDAVRVRVIDRGCGIGAEDLKRIFEPFFSLRDGGTGLGLFLALSFVRQWGGDIQVESAPGEGSIFELVLPLLETGSEVE